MSGVVKKFEEGEEGFILYSLQEMENELRWCRGISTCKALTKMLFLQVKLILGHFFFFF